MTGLWFQGFRAHAACVIGAAFVAQIALSTATEAAGRSAAFVIDANTGAVISATNADEPRHPASLTKMMTLYITFDLLQQGRLSETTRITISPNAAAAQPTKLGLEPDSDIALIDAVKSLVTLSANDMAIAIAERVAGSEERFAALMTQKAHAIGMHRTVFKNASGLPNSEQVTTARDMVTLGLRLHDDFPKYYALFAMRDFRYAGRNHPNHNTMLGSFEGTEGIKTGYTQASGFNLVASVKRDSKHVMGAVFGGVTASSRNQSMRALLNLALNKASPVRTRLPAGVAARIRPAPSPQPEARPQPPAVVAARPAPPLVARAAAPVPVASAQAAVEPAGTIQIARVRPVLVAPLPRGQRGAVVPESQTGVTVAAPPPVRLASAASTAAAPLDYALPPIAAGTVAEMPKPRMAAPFQPQLAAAFAPQQAQAVAPARGLPPSTFQQQAANLGGLPQPAAMRAQAPFAQPAPPRPGVTVASASSVEIQIGAYASAAEAERQINAARAKAADLIGTAEGKTQPTVANGKALWRARFSGFQAANAGSICTELRRRQIDCLVARSD